ncbi:MAG: hypothetical protein ACKVTZ_22180 [Bacteroidia bacterium]
MKTQNKKTSPQCLKIVVTLQTGLQEFLKAEKVIKKGFWFVQKPRWYVSVQIATAHGIIWTSLGEASDKAELLKLIQDNFSYIESIECVIER